MLSRQLPVNENITMKVTPEQLKDPDRYRLIRVLRHDDIIHFVMEQIRQLRWPMILFYTLAIAFLAMVILFSLGNFAYNYISWGLFWKYLVLGIITGMLVVIPFHELLHGLAYYLAGAEKVKYGADLKQLLFYASAPGFVTGRKAFYLVAFTPFVVLNLVFAAGIIWGPPGISWGSLVAIFVHTTMCIGDFAMVNYFAAFPDDKVFTYDEDKTKKSFFYLKKK